MSACLPTAGTTGAGAASAVKLPLPLTAQDVFKADLGGLGIRKGCMAANAMGVPQGTITIATAGVPSVEQP